MDLFYKTRATRGAWTPVGRAGLLAAMLGAPLLSAALVLPAPAARADTASLPSANPDAAGGIEEITVTAQRYKQPSQQVGIALSAITPAMLAAHGAVTVNDLQYLTPSLQVTPQFGSSQPGFRIRGVGFDDYASNNSPTVGIYVDEVAFPIPAMTQGQIFDVERVEVLRGPQGTLYGRNTTGGAINFITNKPTAEVSAGGTIEYGRYNEARIDGYVSGPVSDSIRVRLAGTTDQGGAWQHSRDTGQALGDKDKSALRTLVDYDATDTLKFELDVHGSRDRSDALGLYLITPLLSPTGAVLVPADIDHTATGWGTSASFAKEIHISPDRKPFLDNEGWGTDLRADWTLPFATLTSLSSYEGLDRREYNNFDAVAAADADVYFDSRAATYAEELRLASLSDDPLRWQTGLYYSREHLNEVYRSGFIDSLGVNAYTPYTQDAETESAFGQGEYRFADDWKFLLGLRYEHETRDLKDLNTFGILGSGLVIPFATDISRHTAFYQPTGKAELQYDAAKDVMLYASVSRGIKSGGFTAYNTTTPNGAATDPFKPEELWAYELGVKSEFDEHRIRINAAGYYYDYKNQQVQSAIVDPLYGEIGKIVNAPASEIWGGEIEATWKPVEALVLTQSAGYTRGKYDTFEDVGGDFKNAAGLYEPIFVNRAGQDTGAPKLTLTGSADYIVPAGAYTIDSGIDYSYRGHYGSHFGTLYNIGAYLLADAHVTLAQADGPWSLTFWGRNIFNRTYDLTRNFFVGGDNIGAAGEPATYGFRIGVKY